jgi:hypothetical protein
LGRCESVGPRGVFRCLGNVGSFGTTPPDVAVLLPGCWLSDPVPVPWRVENDPGSLSRIPGGAVSLLLHNGSSWSAFQPALPFRSAVILQAAIGKRCGFQKRKRNPAVGAMLLRWRKPKANPPFTCVNMTPK